MTPRPADTTLGELRASGWRSRSVKEEMRANLLARIGSGERFLPGILGYDDTVLPQLENAILAGQDVILLGERGQAKSRIARSLVALLDPWLPYLAGTELHDDPLRPISPLGRQIVADEGDAAPIAWWAAEDRYSEKLATPDISIADLIGEVDPVRVAEGRYLSDELTIHYGLLPRTHRGIFSLNELPDLAERIQVGLLNVMEERDVQVRGYRVRLELDLFVIASANPEDYTSRGRIITPLKDRFGAQIRTHYPEEAGTEIAIMESESASFDDGRSVAVEVPGFMKEIVAELSQLARRSSEVSQRSGVSVRVTIANHETLTATALKRAVRLGETSAAPRISDLSAVVASTAGKIELETLGDETREDRVVEKLVARSVVNVFNRHFALSELAGLIDRFESEGIEAEVGESVTSDNHVGLVDRIPELRAAIARLDTGESPAGVASATEFVLEGLHLNRRLNKERRSGGVR
ncbi:MAG TPA: sigma 54-interacting transcriptional regulator, partial [Solirubrobacterales bacterium]|nr:sigma 54-interacting transcriptional regulator [Solirubrobacterales bacterium]